MFDHFDTAIARAAEKGATAIACASGTLFFAQRGKEVMVIVQSNQNTCINGCWDTKEGWEHSEWFLASDTTNFWHRSVQKVLFEEFKGLPPIRAAAYAYAGFTCNAVLHARKAEYTHLLTPSTISLKDPESKILWAECQKLFTEVFVEKTGISYLAITFEVIETLTPPAGARVRVIGPLLQSNIVAIAAGSFSKSMTEFLVNKTAEIRELAFSQMRKQELPYPISVRLTFVNPQTFQSQIIKAFNCL